LGWKLGEFAKFKNENKNELPEIDRKQQELVELTLDWVLLRLERWLSARESYFAECVRSFTVGTFTKADTLTKKVYLALLVWIILQLTLGQIFPAVAYIAKFVVSGLMNVIAFRQCKKLFTPLVIRVLKLLLRALWPNFIINTALCLSVLMVMGVFDCYRLSYAWEEIFEKQLGIPIPIFLKLF